MYLDFFLYSFICGLTLNMEQLQPQCINIRCVYVYVCVCMCVCVCVCVSALCARLQELLRAKSWAVTRMIYCRVPLSLSLPYSVQSTTVLLVFSLCVYTNWRLLQRCVVFKKRVINERAKVFWYFYTIHIETKRSTLCHSNKVNKKYRYK